MPRTLLPVVLIAAAFGLLPGCADPGREVVTVLPEPVMPAREGRIERRAPLAPQARKPAPKRASASASGLPDGVNPPGGLRRNWQYIVIHHSASDSGSAQHFDRFHRFQKGWDELGYHFVIGNGRGSGDGSIEVGSRWWKQKHGAHCKTPDNRYNDYGIGICLVGDFEAGGGPSRAQMQSLGRLVRYLAEACEIHQSNINTHGGVTHKTACPGRSFPFSTFMRSLSLQR